MEFVGNETCDKLIWTPDKGYKKTNTISKQGTPKSNTKKTYPSSTFGFGFYPYKETWDIFSED